MSPINHVRRRLVIAAQIARDPWTVVVRREGRTPDDADSQFTVTGRISPTGARFITTMVPRRVLGEQAATRYSSVLVVPWDTQAIKEADFIVATHDGSGITRNFTVVFARRVPYKFEVLLDERQ